MKKKNKDLVAFGDLIRIKRLTLKWSQFKLATEANMHYTYIGNVERAERNLTFLNILKLAKALKCSPKDLIPEQEGN